MRAAFDAAWLVSDPGLSRWVCVELLEGRVEVVADRQGDIGGGEDHAGKPTDGRDRDEGAHDVVGGRARREAAPTAQW